MKIVVEISGGCLVAVYADDKYVEVDLVDWDNIQNTADLRQHEHLIEKTMDRGWVVKRETLPYQVY